MNSNRQEFLQRGTFYFPIQYYFCDSADPVYQFPMHWHMEYEIIHILKGSGHFYLRNGDTELGEGCVCFIMSRSVHGGGEAARNCVYESAVFDINMLRAQHYAPDVFISDIVSGIVCVHDVISSGGDAVSEIAVRLFEALKEKKDGYEFFVCAYLMELFGVIKRDRLYSEIQIADRKYSLQANHVRNVFQFIEENYGRPIRLEELAATAGLSPKYFCRVFRGIVHKTPVEYLNRFRIDRACAKIRETDAPLSEIAAACGFRDFSYFIKTFKRYKGITPYKYRRSDPALLGGE